MKYGSKQETMYQKLCQTCQINCNPCYTCLCDVILVTCSLCKLYFMIIMDVMKSKLNH
jgi:hypothetical protein